MTVVMRAWFRALAAAFKSPAPAQTVAGVSLLMLTLYTGQSRPFHQGYDLLTDNCCQVTPFRDRP